MELMELYALNIGWSGSMHQPFESYEIESRRDTEVNKIFAEISEESRKIQQYMHTYRCDMYYRSV